MSFDRTKPNTSFGMLTIANAETVAQMLRDLLENTEYVFVSSIESREPRVRVGQRLDDHNAITVRYDELRKYASVYVNDTYGLWGMSTVLLDDEKYDPAFNNPYVSFKDGGVTITHRAPCGDKICWVVKPLGDKG